MDIMRAPVGIKVGEKHLIDAHRGFAEATVSVWADVRTIIEENLEKNEGLRIWFAGHSLGGAVATIAAYMTYATFGDEPIAGLCTIGQPRVLRRGEANTKFALDLGPDRIFRVYRSIDPVPLMPWLGYKHVSGNRCFIKKNGKFVYDASWRVKYFDWARKFIRIGRRVVTQFRLTHLKTLVSDHFSQGYLDALVYTKSLPLPQPRQPMRTKIAQGKALLKSLFSSKNVHGIDFDTSRTDRSIEPGSPDG